VKQLKGLPAVQRMLQVHSIPKRMNEQTITCVVAVGHLFCEKFDLWGRSCHRFVWTSTGSGRNETNDDEEPEVPMMDADVPGATAATELMSHPSTPLAGHANKRFAPGTSMNAPKRVRQSSATTSPAGRSGLGCRNQLEECNVSIKFYLVVQLVLSARW
jgi:hypothetical protein